MLGRVLLAALAGYVALAAMDLLDRLNYDKQLKFNDDKCTLLTEMDTAVEDLSLLGDGHCAFGGGGDLWNTFMHGSAAAKDGDMWLINATSGKAYLLPIHGKSKPTKIVFHGIYYSQQSKQLYAVNHDEAAGESVEVFAVSGHAPALRLDHVASVRSPLFQNMALNDVVEGVDGSEFYVSEWQAFPFPTEGKKTSAAVPPAVKAGRLAMTMYTFFKVAQTRVFRCTLLKGSASSEPQPECTVATAERYVGANGLAVSADRTKVYVNDPGAQRISVLSRETDGMLTPVGSITPNHIVDNIEMIADGVLSGGTIPLPYACATVCEDAPFLAQATDVDGRSVGCGKAPGSVLSIKLESGGIQDYEQMDVLMHDGSLLSDVSAGMQVGQHTLLGSPHSTGVLLCTP